MSSNEQEISLSIEDTNKLRKSLGLPLLKTENDAVVKEKAQVQAKQDFEKKREKEKTRKELIERIKQEKVVALSTKNGVRAAISGLGSISKKEDNIDDTLAWASSLGQKQKKTLKKIEKQKSKELKETEAKEYREDDLQGLKVAHRMDDLKQDTILVLKDSQINDDDQEVDELMNVNITDLDQARKAQLLKKGPKKHDPYEEFDRAQMGLDKKILSYYDDPTADDDTGFILGAKGQVNYEHERKMREEKKVLGVVPLGGIALDYEKTKEMADFYTKEEELAFKKPKKKKKVSRKRKDIDEDKMNEINQEEDTEMMDDGPVIHKSFSNSNKTRDIGATNFVDDDDLQALLAKSRQKANCKSNVALRVLEEAAEEATYIVKDEQEGGLVISDLTEFVGNLSGISSLVPKSNASKRNGTNDSAKKEDNNHDESDLDMDMDVDNEKEQPDDLEDGEEIEEEDHIDLFNMAKPVSKGLAATLSLLKSKGEIKEATDEEKQRNTVERKRLEWLAEQRKKEAREERKLEREKAQRRDGKQPRMDDWERQQQIRESERIKAEEVARRYANYKPNFDITYRDEHGRELNPKQAFKELAQKFHGHKSGKKKTEKKLLKLQEEVKIKNLSSTDTLLQSATRFAEQAEKTGNAYLSLSKGGKDVIPEVDLSTLIPSSTSKELKSKSLKASSANSKSTMSSSAISQGFQVVEPIATVDSQDIIAAPVSTVPVSRPKITFGLSTKKGKFAK